MMEATAPRTYGQSRFKMKKQKRKRKTQKQKGSHSKKTRFPNRNRSNERSALVIQSLLAEKDCQNEMIQSLLAEKDCENKMMIVIPEQTKRCSSDFAQNGDEVETSLVRDALGELWDVCEPEIFQRIASHLDLQSLKIFMFLSKNIHYSLLHQKSSDNSWAVEIYYEFFSNTCIVEKGIERAINSARIVNRFYQSPFCNQEKIDSYKVVCNCTNCLPMWMIEKPNHKIGNQAHPHSDTCTERWCDCGISGSEEWFGPELHCRCIHCNDMNFDFAQSYIKSDKCKICMTTPLVFSPYPEDFDLSDYPEIGFSCNANCHGCGKHFEDLMYQNSGHCPHCDTSKTVKHFCEDCWYWCRFKKKKMYFVSNTETMPFFRKEKYGTKVSKVSMSPAALKKFNGFSLSEVVSNDKRDFRINRWFRFANLLLGRNPRILHIWKEGPIYPENDDY